MHLLAHVVTASASWHMHMSRRGARARRKSHRFNAPLCSVARACSQGAPRARLHPHTHAPALHIRAHCTRAPTHMPTCTHTRPPRRSARARAPRTLALARPHVCLPCRSAPTVHSRPRTCIRARTHARPADPRACARRTAALHLQRPGGAEGRRGRGRAARRGLERRGAVRGPGADAGQVGGWAKAVFVGPISLYCGPGADAGQAGGVATWPEPGA